MNTLDELKPLAEDILCKLVEGNFSAVVSLFDSAMLQALPEAKLKEIWLQMVGQAGQFKQELACKAVELGVHRIVTVTCQFENAVYDINVVFNQQGQVGGLNYQMAAAYVTYHAPAYVDESAFHEAEVTVGSGEWALPATLSLPVGPAPFPALVLVHGSGPNDRDESLGPNKVFRDLAWGLASQGIAVLRYEKRTKAHASQFTPELIARLTVQEETIDDALAAVQLLRQNSAIDPSRIYVLGHSLGATVAPRIGQQDPAIAGLIIMAGMARTFEDTILDQFTYLYGLSGAMSDAQKADLEQLKRKVARVKDPTLSNKTPANDLPLNISPSYWLDLRANPPTEIAKTLAMRLLIMQGGRDYQVSAAGDFPLWQKALAGKNNVTFKLYPKLYHLFIAGEGPSTPQEYSIEGHVSEEVIHDIAHWILGGVMNIL